jgi:nitrite reductase/ring-hydroxylating ferredoxin subunit
MLTPQHPGGTLILLHRQQNNPRGARPMRVPLIDDAQVHEGQAHEVDFLGRPVLVTRTDGQLRAYMNVCTHLGGPLQLAADGTHFQCQWHHACFDSRSGKATCPPARADSRLIRLPIKVEAGQVTYVYGEPDQPPEAGA